MNKCAWLVCSFLLPLAASAAYLNDYATNDVAVTAGFIPDTNRITLGEPIFLTFVVSNRADNPYQFSTGGAYRGSLRDNNFIITATNSAGHAVKDPHGYNHWGGMLNPVKLAPGQDYHQRLLLNHWCAFAEPGEYTVTCLRRIDRYLGWLGGPHGVNSPPLVIPVPSPMILATTFTLTLLPADRNRLGEVIEKWGRQIQANDSLADAALALGEVNDTRCIPHLAALLTKGESGNKIPAINALVRSTNNLTIADDLMIADALIGALKDRDHAVAERASTALSALHQIDRAVDTFLPELTNPPPNVRVGAARALGLTRSGRASDPLLVRLRQDDNPSVRDAAAEALASIQTNRQVLAELYEKLNDPD